MATKKQVQTVCNPTSHDFVHVETTSQPIYGNAMQGLGQLGGGSVSRSFVIYCSRCGAVKRIV